MNLIEVNQKSCKQDGVCAAVCPANLIDFNKGAYPSPIAEAEKICIRCGHCVSVCQSASLIHKDIPLEECSPIQQELLLSEQQSEQFLRSRRSIRNYRKDTVPQEKLQKLIETARYAPTGHNTQSAEWLVLREREELERLIGLVGEWMKWMLAKMPEIASSLHLDLALERLDSGEDVVLRDAPLLIVAHAPKSDIMASATCTIALAHLELAACGMELGTCWAGYFNAAATTFPPMIKALGLPEGHQCFGAMMVGYPQFSYHRVPPRKAPVITWR